ncbi:MAG: CvpA family protein [Clostridiales bacterium]|jgi:uncharacterized membrane protein required for colicin V production|nr:CvpA family protein [Clostridiales bacterium]
MLVDIVVALIILIGLIIGWQQGLYKFFKKILPVVGSLVAAAFLCKLLAEYVNQSFNTSLIDWVTSWFSKIGDVVNLPVITEEGKLFVATTEGNVSLAQVFKDSGFGVFSGTIEAVLAKLITFDGTTSIADKIIPFIALALCYAASFIAIFFVSLIIIGIFTKIVGKLITKNFFKYADKFIGSIVWTALFIFIVYGLFALITLFETESVMQPFMEYLEQSTAANIMYDNNIFLILIKEIGNSFAK